MAKRIRGFQFVDGSGGRKLAEFARISAVRCENRIFANCILLDLVPAFDLRVIDNMTDAIVTERLTKHYGGRRVVDSLDLRVPQGQRVRAVGPQRGGQITAIKMLMGMVRPDSGRATLLGEDAETLSECDACPDRLSGRGASALRLDDDRRGGEVHAVVLSAMERYARRADPRPLRTAAAAEVSPAVERAAGPGVAGAGRGAGSGTAGARRPHAGLDTVVRRDFLESLIQIIQRQGRTILFSSHILGDVERVADRIGIMVNGVLRVDCPTETFRESVRKLVLEFAGYPPESP